MYLTSLAEFERKFIKKFFPSITEQQWINPLWQMQNRFTKLTDIEPFISLPNKQNINELEQRLPFAVTPYYLALTYADNINLQPIFIPTKQELQKDSYTFTDPLSEEVHTKDTAIVHKYPNRVLFLLTNQCPVYCRYCTRARFSGKDTIITKEKQATALAYIQDHTEIEEVILSGGDPLFLPDTLLLSILQEIEKIEHIRYIRIHTRTPIVLPYRITEKLGSILAKINKPLWIHIHVIHTNEITPAFQKAAKLLRQAGIGLFSQTVLLNQINNTHTELHTLIQALLSSGIRPYALYQCDLIQGTKHFRTPLKQGIELIQSLKKNTSGIGIPHFVVEPPEGKVTLAPNNIIDETNESFILRAWNDKQTSYPKEKN